MLRPPSISPLHSSSGPESEVTKWTEAEACARSSSLVLWSWSLVLLRVSVLFSEARLPALVFVNASKQLMYARLMSKVSISTLSRLDDLTWCLGLGVNEVLTTTPIQPQRVLSLVQRQMLVWLQSNTFFFLFFSRWPTWQRLSFTHIHLVAQRAVGWYLRLLHRAERHRLHAD